MFCYVIEENSGLKTVVKCDSKEQALELFINDLDNFIKTYYESTEEFEECNQCKYKEVITIGQFEVDYELYARVEDIIPIEVEKRNILPNCFDGWNVHTYREYKEMEY